MGKQEKQKYQKEQKQKTKPIMIRKEDLKNEIGKIIFSKEREDAFSDVISDIIDNKFREKIPEEFDSQTMKMLIGLAVVSRLEKLEGEAKGI